MASPSGSTLSKLRRYDPSNPRIVPFERCDHAHRSTGYTHNLREVVLMGLTLVSNRQVAKITVHAHRGGALYCGNVACDAEAQPTLSESERTNFDPWLGDDVYRMLGQGYAETFP